MIKCLNSAHEQSENGSRAVAVLNERGRRVGVASEMGVVLTPISDYVAKSFDFRDGIILKVLM